MSTSSWEHFRRVDAVFDRVLDVADEHRTAFIEQACGSDDVLRHELLELLAAHRHPGGLLEAPAVQLVPLIDGLDPEDEPLPERIGHFQVERAVGQGGMGRVYLGVRREGDFEQRVAIKVLRHGVPGLVRRFLEERRILALLEHPAIARFIDGGVTPDGLPWFALEYVEGEPIDWYCASRRLSLEQRLALFIDVCEAVSYAHRHLVIHRDLKPSNILVTASGQVKLLDFGIAKLLGDGDRADETRTEFRAMTPEYAAPEQVRGGPVSTATDVYSLGVLLYRLVTGERPYDLRGRSPAEIERIVCEGETTLPSTRMPGSLARAVRGDLDLIVMTALQKEPARRYHAPQALAEDLRRLRAREPILARPDSARYRLRKFVGRHRAGVLAVAAGALALAGVAARERALRGRAEVAVQRATAVESFLVGVFDVADPFSAKSRDGKTVTAGELLEQGAQRIDTTLRDQPEVQAEVRSVLGRVYASLGLYDRATPMLERSLAQRRAIHGPVHPRVAHDKDLLGVALMRLDRYDEAEPLLREALAERRALLGSRHVETAESMQHLATLLEQRSRFEEAEVLHREALAVRRAALGDTARDVATSLTNLGLVRFRRGAYAEAESLYRRALDIERPQYGDGSALTAQTMQNLAQVLQLRGRYEESEKWYRQSLATKRRVLGNEHPSVTITLNNLGGLLSRYMGRLEEGEALTREALALDRKMFGDRHSYVAQGLANLGVILRQKGDFAGAERLHREALQINLALLGERHQYVGTNYLNIAAVRSQLGDARGAVPLLRSAHDIYREKLGEKHANTLIAKEALARALCESGNPAEAETLSREAIAGLDSSNARERAVLVRARRTLGEAMAKQGRAREAIPVLEGALALSRAQHGERDARTADVQLAYGSALVAAGRVADGASALRAAHQTLRAHRAEHPRLAARAAAAVRELAMRQG